MLFYHELIFDMIDMVEKWVECVMRISSFKYRQQQISFDFFLAP